MKKTIKFCGLIAGIASLLVSCQKEKLTDTIAAPEMEEFSVAADYDAETKTAMYKDSDKYLYKWNENGEKLTVSEFSLKNNVVSVESQVSNEGVLKDGKMSFSVSFKSKTAENYTYYSVYPSKAFQSSSINNENNKITLNVELPEVQNPKADSFDPSADILVSKPFKGKPGENGFDFELKRQSVGVKMNVRNFAKKDKEGNDINYTGEEREYIEKITITSENSKISGKTSYIFENGTVPGMTQKTYGTNNTVILDYTTMVDGEAHAGLAIDGDKGNSIYFTTWPFVASSDNSLSIKVQTTNYIFTKNFDFKDRVLPFNKSEITSFNVGFNSEDVTIEKKEVPEALLKESYYVVTLGKKAMIAEQSEKYIASKEIGTAEGNITLEYDEATGAYKIDDNQQLTAVWKFEYNNISGKYLISSVSDPDKYLKGSGDQSLTLVSKENATSFSIEQPEGADYYTVIASGRYLGCVSRFSMQYTETDNSKIKITKANISSTIQVQEEYGIPVTGGKDFFIPVSLLNVKEETVEVSTEDSWISNLSFDNGIKFDAEAGSEDVSREATITIKGKNISNTADEVTETVKVVQHHSVYYASLLSSEIKDAYKEGKWGTYDKEYSYTQPNGAGWVIACQESVGFMTMTVNSGYIKLPSFGEGRSIRRVKIMLNNVPYANRFIGLYPSAASNEAIATVDITEADKAAGQKEYVITVDAAGINTAYIKTNTQLAISGIEVDARKPLPAPDAKQFKVEGKTLSWKTVDNAKEYDVTVGSTTVKDTDGTEYTFTGADEWYDVTVVAKADPASAIYIDSNPSETAKLKFGNPQLNAPELKEAGAKQHTLKVTWTTDKRADGYKCSISPKGTILNQGEGVVEFEGLDADSEYTVTVQATSNGDYDNSETSTIKVKTADIKLQGDGSVSTPYTVTDVNAFVENNKELNLTDKYVKGTVSEVNGLNNGQLSYIITDGVKYWNVTGKDLGEAGFSSKDQLSVDSEVVIYYSDNDTNYLYSIDGQTSILSGIEIGTETKTGYEWNEAFVNPVVYASYRGADKKEVSGFTVASKPATVTKPATLTVTYTEGSVTKSAEYSIVIVKFTHKYMYTANDGVAYEPKTITNGGITTNLKNFFRTSETNFTGKPNCSVTTETIAAGINTIEITVTSNQTDDETGTLKILDNNNKEVKSIDITFKKGANAISLGGVYENSKYTLTWNPADSNTKKRLLVSQIVFEKK